MRALLLLAVVGTLSSCATEAWNFPPDGNNAKFNQDSYACTREAQQQSSNAYVNSYGGAAQSGTYTNTNLYNQCMYARGYYLSKKSELPPKPQLPDELYVLHARQKLTASKCVASGSLAPELVALLDRSGATVLANHTYSQQKLSEAWANESATFIPSPSDCDRLAAFAAYLKSLQEAKGN